MKMTRSVVPQLITSFCLLGAAVLAGCASDDGTDDTGTGGMTGASGGMTGASGGGTGETGGMTGDGDAANPNEGPADASQASIEAFLAAGTYQSAPWIGDAAVRGSTDPVNVHGNEMKVFFNSAAAAVKANGGAADMGAMVVKELYEGGALIGKAVEIKTGTETGFGNWTYYCSQPSGSTVCSGDAETETTFYGASLQPCSFCHGEIPASPLPQ